MHTFGKSSSFMIASYTTAAICASRASQSALQAVGMHTGCVASGSRHKKRKIPHGSSIAEQYPHVAPARMRKRRCILVAKTRLDSALLNAIEVGLLLNLGVLNPLGVQSVERLTNVVPVAPSL